MKKFNFRNINWKGVIAAILVTVLAVGSVVGIASFIKNDSKQISDMIFSRGAIDPDTGVYVESKTSIYNEDLIECQGLKIDPDFETTGTYQIFYYGEYKSFVGATDKIKATDGVYERGDTFPVAKYCRIVISPDTPVDDDGKVEEDWKINFWEVIGYASDYTITVDKKQSYSAPNVFETCLKAKGYIPSVDWETNLFIEKEDSAYSYCSILNVDGWDSVRLLYEDAPGELSYFFYTEKSAYVSEGDLSEVNAGTDFFLDIPEGAYMLCLIYTESNPPAIYPIA